MTASKRRTFRIPGQTSELDRLNARPSVGGATIVPEHYPPNALDIICERIAMGETLPAICAESRMPSPNEVTRWLLKDDGFQARYIDAQKIGVLVASSAMQDIADGGTSELHHTTEREDPKTGEMVVTKHYRKEDAYRSSLRVKTMQWRLTKLVPQFADKVTQEHGVTGDLKKLMESASNRGHRLPEKLVNP